MVDTAAPTGKTPPSELDKAMQHVASAASLLRKVALALVSSGNRDDDDEAQRILGLIKDLAEKGKNIEQVQVRISKASKEQ